MKEAQSSEFRLPILGGLDQLKNCDLAEYHIGVNDLQQVFIGGRIW